MKYTKLTQNDDLKALLDAAEKKGVIRALLETVIEKFAEPTNKISFCYQTKEWGDLIDRPAFCDILNCAMNGLVLDNHLTDIESKKIGESLVDEDCKAGFRLTEDEVKVYLQHAKIPALAPPHYDFNSLYVTANLVWSEHLAERDKIDFGECAPTEYRIVKECVTKAIWLLSHNGTTFRVREHFGLDGRQR